MRWKRTRMCLITEDYMAHHQMAWYSCISLANGFIIPNFRWCDYRSHQMVTNLNDLGPPHGDGVLRFTECMMTGSTSKSSTEMSNKWSYCSWFSGPSWPLPPHPLSCPLIGCSRWAESLGYQACQYLFIFYFFLFLSWQLIYCHISAGFTQQTSLLITD